MNVRELDKYTAHQFRLDRAACAELDMIGEKADEALSLAECKSLVIYHCWLTRDSEKAGKYASLYKARTIPGSQDYAEACNYLGYAQTIDPTNKNMQEFELALDICKNTHSEVEAFSYRFIALMQHRNKNLTEALVAIQQAIDIERSLVLTNSLVKIALAESLHIQGVIFYANKNYRESEKSLEDARRLELEFVEETKCEHFLVMTTAQSYARTLIQLDQADEALKILQEAYRRQAEYFKTDSHHDMAKTLHFIGEAYVALKKWEEAVNVFNQAIEMKKAVLGEGNEAIQWSVIERDKALKNLLPSSPRRTHEFLAAPVAAGEMGRAPSIERKSHK